jgi:hypothetical protein
MYHAYTHHVLNQLNPKASDAVIFTVAALQEALSDYLPCSYQGVSKFGAKFVEMRAKDLPSDVVKSGFLRNLQSTSKIDPGETEPHKAGEAWAAALWEIRATLGCSPDVAQCQRADKMLLEAWASPWIDQASPKTAQHFAQAIIAAIARSGTPQEAKQARSIFQHRGLELP